MSMTMLSIGQKYCKAMRRNWLSGLWKTDPMSNSERKIIHRISSRIDGVTSYSEGDEPNRYVVVDIDSE